MGGPEETLNNNAFLAASAPLSFDIAESSDDVAGFVVFDGAFILSPGSSLSNILPTRDGLMIYKIQPGDTLSTIAANFGISLNTLFEANQNLTSRSILRAGQEIVVLPVSGTIHQVRDGETLDSIAALYSVDQAKILQFNKKIIAGANIIVPGAKSSKKSSAYSASGSLPKISGYFTIPTTGWNWGNLHYNNAVDMANACGTPIYATAEGLVAEASSGWNGGYGNVVLIEHPNKTSARYAHLQKLAVSVGQYVVQGDLIAYMGNTGNTHGPTGCHLHFEIVGAQNPFAKR